MSIHAAVCVLNKLKQANTNFRHRRQNHEIVTSYTSVCLVCSQMGGVCHNAKSGNLGRVKNVES